MQRLKILFGAYSVPSAGWKAKHDSKRPKSEDFCWSSRTPTAWRQIGYPGPKMGTMSRATISSRRPCRLSIHAHLDQARRHPCRIRQNRPGDRVMENIRPIKTEADYDWAIAEITAYFDNQPEPGTAAGDRFDVLSALVEAYENEHHPISAPDPTYLRQCVARASPANSRRHRASNAAIAPARPPDRPPGHAAASDRAPGRSAPAGR